MFDVRNFLGRLGVAAGLAAASATLAIPAHAQDKCSAANRYEVNWQNYNGFSLAVNTLYSATITNAAGNSITFYVRITGDTGDLGNSSPQINTNNSGGLASSYAGLYLYANFDNRQDDIDDATNTDIVVVEFGFSEVVRDVRFDIFDIDFSSNRFRDWIGIRNTTSGGGSTATVTPTGGTGATAFAGATTLTVDGESLTVHADDAYGAGGGSGSTEALGNVTFYLEEDVQDFEVRYANLGSTSENTRQQAISIHDISFCAMPELTIAKSVAPYVSTGRSSFAVPGNDLVYTFDISNVGESQVDDGEIVITDLLPGNISIFTGDHSGSGSPFAVGGSASGISCCASVEYGSGSPVSWGASANGSYDSSITGIRLTPSGDLPEDENLTISFRVKID